MTNQETDIDFACVAQLVDSNTAMFCFLLLTKGLGVARISMMYYNAIAKQVVSKLNANSADTNTANISVVDLFSSIESYCGTNYTSCPIQLDDNLILTTVFYQVKVQKICLNL